ncbi:hypothetical protein GCM10011506_18640 [Marivirga lumbricoides]|uniref:Uncharacterized protein n=1 Tax=Marivirga lumbricoides TaxID=1046115 RepID=A0ABQ1M237_9BACT|nr:hypothetical protein GCM10011506_18640 [Marivirga lumbricoides]
MKQQSNITHSMRYLFIFLFILLNYITPTYLNAQVEFTTWGNLTGIRVDNQLMQFNSSLVLIDEEKSFTRVTRKEAQTTDFERTDLKKIFSYEMGEIRWKETIQSLEKGTALIDVELSTKADTLIDAAFFRIELPEEFDNSTIFKVQNENVMNLESISTYQAEANYIAPLSKIIVSSTLRKLEISFSRITQVMVKNTSEGNIRLDFLIQAGEVLADTIYSNQFTIKASGEIDRSVVNLKVFPEQEGKQFDGVGGNFRLQNPSTDPQVIDYSLKNLRVSWSRVELPWSYWHPDLSKNPIDEAKKGNLHPKVRDAMEMAKRLDQQGIPVILATWFAPEWAIIGKRAEGVNIDGSRGNALDQTKKQEIYESITSYIQFLKKEYGVETVMFSFNESDLGIDVRQTPEEHNQLIKELGAYFRKRGVETDFLLGDTADADGWPFTTLASTDPETRPFIGGVSFHSWRGWTDENLLKWLDISNRVGKPLFIGEGSIDAGAWRYPGILEEPTYALDEIDVYLKILAKAQPLSILQWQLTADYSVMSGGGVFGNTEKELHPTQRFFNLQQLGATPQGSFSIPATISKKGLTVAAYKEDNNTSFTLHVVNKGASREVKIEGIPDGIDKLNVRVTNRTNSNKKVKTIKVKNGIAEYNLEGASFISFFSK